jgi:DNA repair protein RadC
VAIISKYRLHYVREPNAAFDRERRTITNKHDFVEAAKKYLTDIPYEAICIYALDNNNKIIGFMTAEGDINQCQVYPKNVFRFLISVGAANFILAHNHPGGNTKASESDWNITKKLQNMGKIVEIEMLDHVIVCENVTISLRDYSRWENGK